VTVPSPVVFLGTPAAAVTVLDAIVRAGHPVELVVTRPDARRGRGNRTSPSPVKARAQELGLSVTDSLDDLADAELPAGCTGVVVAYGRIIPAAMLERIPMLNVHFSLLPRWRGAAPVERAMLAGDTTTGVCIMEMEAGLDTGPVRVRAETEIGEGDTAPVLTARLAEMGGRLMCEVLGGAHPVAVAQEGEVTYAHKISAADLVIDWSATTDEVLRRIRAVPAHTSVGGKRLRIVDASPATGTGRPGELSADGSVATGDGRILLGAVQPEGRNVMPAADWLRGANLGLPVVLGG